MVVRHVSVRVGRLACVSCGGVVSFVSGVARNGKVGACSEGWRALAVRFVRLGEPCGVGRPGWGGWSDGGVTPLRGCVLGGDWADVVGVWRGCRGWGWSRSLRCDLDGLARSSTVLKAFACGACDR